MKKHIYFYFVLFMFCLINFSQIGLAQENDEDSTDYAIVINGGDPNDQFTKGDDTKANRFAKLLESRGVDPENIQKPGITKDSVKAAFDSLKGKLECGDNLIIYFIGHGSEDGDLVIGENLSPPMKCWCV